MDTKLKGMTRRLPGMKAVIISALVFSALLLAIAGQMLYAVLNNNKVYDGVYIDDINVSGNTAASLAELLDKEYKSNTQELAIELKAEGGDASVVFGYDDIAVEFGIDAVANEAYGVGRKGNIYARLTEIVRTKRNGYRIKAPVVAFDREKLAEQIDKLYNMTLIEVDQTELVMANGKAVLSTGRHGEYIDRAALQKRVEELIYKRAGGVLEAQIIVEQPKPVNVDEYYNKILKEPVNAALAVVNGAITVTPEEIGRKIDRAALERIVAEADGEEGTERVLPVELLHPAISQGDMENKALNGVIGSYSTIFDTSTTNNANRGENIRLASAKINGTVLLPGEVFSFNDVVGRRTAEAGYKSAHAYSSEGIIDDIGGGICQVSTTLYNAVLRAGLDTVERVNHMYTVGYVEIGTDAAVSYGEIDYKFKNTTGWPVRIDAYVTDENELIFNIVGTNEHPGRSIVLYSTITDYIDYPTEYVDDSSISAGEYEVVRGGMMGYYVDTFKVVRQDGTDVSEEKLHRSYYQPLSRIIKRGMAS